MTKQAAWLFTIFMSLAQAAVFPAISVHAGEPEGLVLYYTFDTDQKDNVTDFSGSGNNAAIKGQPEWVEGKMGKALNFELSGQYLEAPHSDSLTPDEITITMWVNWSGEKLPNTMIQKFTYQVGGYNFKMENSETNLWLYDELSNAHMYRSVPMPVPGEWTHLALTFDGKNQKGYVNGVKGEKGGNVDMPWDGPIGHVDAPLKIGAYSSTNTFTGMLDEVAIYNRALAEEEILEVMENGHSMLKAVCPSGKLADTWGRRKMGRRGI